MCWFWKDYTSKKQAKMFVLQHVSDCTPHTLDRCVVMHFHLVNAPDVINSHKLDFLVVWLFHLFVCCCVCSVINRSWQQTLLWSTAWCTCARYSTIPSSKSPPFNKESFDCVDSLVFHQPSVRTSSFMAAVNGYSAFAMKERDWLKTWVIRKLQYQESG